MLNLYDKNGNIAKIPEIKNTTTLKQSDKIASSVFSQNGEYLTTYRVEPNKAPSDIPANLESYYHFIFKVGATMALDYCTNGVIYAITYVNNDLIFRGLIQNLTPYAKSDEVTNQLQQYISKNESNFFVITSSFSMKTGTTAASSNGEVKIPCERTGYMAIGIVGVECTGTRSSYINIYSAYVNGYGSIAHVLYKNMSTSSLGSDTTIKVDVLFIKAYL